MPREVVTTGPQEQTEYLVRDKRLSEVLSVLARRMEVMTDWSLEPLGLTDARYRVLSAIGAGFDTTAKISRALQVSPPSTSPVVLHLIAKGFIVRADPHARTGRGGGPKQLKLTELGRESLAEADERMSELDERLGSLLGQGEPKATTDALERVLQNLGRAAECSSL